jgi:putative endonuclease
VFYFTYVLECRLQDKVSFYIGYTEDIKARLLKHKSKKVYATKKYDSIKLIYFESCLGKKDAIIREKSLKTGFGRAFIKNRLKYYLSLRV